MIDMMSKSWPINSKCLLIIDRVKKWFDLSTSWVFLPQQGMSNDVPPIEPNLLHWWKRTITKCPFISTSGNQLRVWNVLFEQTNFQLNWSLTYWHFSLGRIRSESKIPAILIQRTQKIGSLTSVTLFQYKTGNAKIHDDLLKDVLLWRPKS